MVTTSLGILNMRIMSGSYFIFRPIRYGTIIGLFIAGVGKSNEEHEYYHEGFVDGYTKAKEEMK